MVDVDRCNSGRLGGGGSDGRRCGGINAINYCGGSRGASPFRGREVSILPKGLAGLSHLSSAICLRRLFPLMVTVADKRHVREVRYGLRGSVTFTRDQSKAGLRSRSRGLSSIT